MIVALRSRFKHAIWRLRKGRIYATPSDTNLERRYRKYKIGDYTYGSPTVLDWNEGSTLKIGRFCSIADGVTILLGGEHLPEFVTTYPFNALFAKARYHVGAPATKGDVVIGNDVWISTGAMILSGVSIGNGAVIAARSVVTRDVPAYAIAAGQPAKVKRYRFNEEQISELLEIAWWTWPAKKIRAAWPHLLSADIAGFLKLYGKD